MEGIDENDGVDQEQLDARDTADVAFADDAMDDNEDDAAFVVTLTMMPQNQWRWHSQWPVFPKREPRSWRTQ